MPSLSLIYNYAVKIFGRYRHSSLPDTLVALSLSKIFFLTPEVSLFAISSWLRKAYAFLSYNMCKLLLTAR